MSATLASTAEEQDLEQQLDQLIPRPLGHGKRFLWGAAVVTLALIVSVLNATGRIYPRPTHGGLSSSGYPLEVDQSEQWVTAKVIMPNYGARSVRITEIGLDAPGATLVGSGVIVDPVDENVVRSGFDEGVVEETGPADMFSPESASILPVTIEPGETAIVVLRFRPDDCANVVDPVGAWGIAEVKVDFGDGAFPPFSNTVRVDQDPIMYDGEPLTFLKPDREIINILPDGTAVEVGVLTGACEALR